MSEPYEFLPGLELNERYFFEVVKPLLDDHYPGLRYSAALIGYGSDVLGFDTEQSMDHNWGPRLQLFLTEQDVAEFASRIDVTLRNHLQEINDTYNRRFQKTAADPDV